jgi:hypothetical protein
LQPLTHRHLVCLQAHDYLVPEITSSPHLERVRLAGSVPVAEIASYQHAAGKGAWLLVKIPVKCSDNVTPDSTYTFKGSYARFALAGSIDGLPLVLDWILHTWLFYAPYKIEEPNVLLEHGTGNRSFLYVPVERVQCQWGTQ